MYFYILVVISVCISLNKTMSLPVIKSQESLAVISESDENDNNDSQDFPYNRMRDFQVGESYKSAAAYSRTSRKKSILPVKSFPWPEPRIPYIIDNHFVGAEYQIIMDAMNEFHKHSCIRFVPYNGEQAYFRLTSSGNGCHSIIGYTGTPHNVYLKAPDCIYEKGTVMHELMHVIGFGHEHNRHDRDDYVTIQWENILKGSENNFYKYKREDMNDFGLPYDFGSLMHYSNNAFANNGGQTIIPKIHLNKKIGQRDGFTRIDILKIKRMYKC